MPDEPHPPVNSVELVGRLAAPPTRATLPSGDEVVSLRLVVRRPPRRGAKGPGVDTIDCSVWSASLARRVQRWRPGDVVRLHGSLRRRFWRTPVGVRSRYEVETTAARRLR